MSLINYHDILLRSSECKRDILIICEPKILFLSLDISIEANRMNFVAKGNADKSGIEIFDSGSYSRTTSWSVLGVLQPKYVDLLVVDNATYDNWSR